jgi:hypothetical protein
MWNLGLLGAASAQPLVLDETYELISTLTASSSTSLYFNNLDALSSTYSHLQVRFIVKWSVNDVCLLMRFNNYAGGGAARFMGGSGGTPYISERQSGNNINLMYYHEGGNSNSWLSGVIDIPNFSSSKNPKTIRGIMGHAATNPRDDIYQITGYWEQGTAINSVAFSGGTGNPAGWQGATMTNGSQFSLYGIKGA